MAVLLGQPFEYYYYYYTSSNQHAQDRAGNFRCAINFYMYEAFPCLALSQIVTRLILCLLCLHGFLECFFRFHVVIVCCVMILTPATLGYWLFRVLFFPRKYIITGGCLFVTF